LKVDQKPEDGDLMKTTSKFAAVLLVLAPMLNASAAEVGVSVQISQPGVYGRIDIGRFPQPQLVVAQPVVITRPVVVVQQAPQPVYMWVPPGHRKNWRKHCGAYNACGVPVYFVQDQWYGQHVDPKGKGHGKGHDKDHGKGQGKGKHGD
jgi:hypothetical protein